MTFLKESLIPGLLAGIIWGMLSMVVNSVTGVMMFEGGFVHNLASFAVGGAVFGIVCGGFLPVAGRFIPFKGLFPKAVIVSAFLWLILRAGGIMLSSMEPDRYHVLTPESIQGFGLSLLLGALIGIFGGAHGKRAGGYSTSP
ncbi:MAG: hypothetical protein HY954_01495 [Deltaproteobacteria bacterium]|nr:hypothetical protein [Deltaproteobacteria bacterium]